MLSPEMRKLSGKLRAMQVSGVTQSQLSKTGISGKTNGFLLCILPAQMTDIVVGVCPGQSPFVVLMQQGGQLKGICSVGLARRSRE
ncbi:phage tail length tape measure family protein [Escherichia coli]|uniref:phage tail length tape measure family protein n=1 Tax=Escherichia coli TaxID=562 RepID=UPI0035B5C54A